MLTQAELEEISVDFDRHPLRYNRHAIKLLATVKEQRELLKRAEPYVDAFEAQDCGCTNCMNYESIQKQIEQALK